ncbi:Putative ribosomal RNA methyltransferase C2G2.15c [Verticillium dahliae VDG1]|nr:Putative ribosomal RNA methyltransferase C2G2.15c [Verticillium dahliae VDG1]
MAAHPVLDLDTTLASLPPPVTQDIRAQVQAQLRAPSSQIPLLVALDDDPTGTQTCHNVNVLTVWDVPTLTAEFSLTPRGSGFFVLTNSRALHPAPARALLVEICTNLQAASPSADMEGER